jgi:hypothetical protein
MLISLKVGSGGTAKRRRTHHSSGRLSAPLNSGVSPSPALLCSQRISLRIHHNDQHPVALPENPRGKALMVEVLQSPANHGAQFCGRETSFRRI